jgi:poly(A) polymerase
MDELEAWIADLAEREELGRMRPPLDGHDVMAFYDLKPSRTIGEALAHLTELRIEHGPMERKAAYAELEAWGRERELVPARTVEEAMALADATRAEAEKETAPSQA